MDLMDYCAFSAAPVGRFVLDVHGESRDLWPGNDALCAALQVINHLQDCGRDRRALDRVYVPLDLFARHGCDVAALDAPAASPELRRCLDELLDRTSGLLDRSEGFATGIRDVRLSFEVAVIHGLARRLVERLRREDPLATRVVAGKAAMLGTAARAAARHALARFGRRAPVLP
jgi:phytoene/squalene synthetase